VKIASRATVWVPLPRTHRLQRKSYTTCTRRFEYHCPALTGRRESHTPLVQEWAEKSDTGAEAVKPDSGFSWDGHSGGWMPVSGMKVRSLVGLSAHPALHWWSAQCAARMLLLDKLMNCYAAGKNGCLDLRRRAFALDGQVSAEWSRCLVSLVRYARDSVAPLRRSSARWMPAWMGRLCASVGRRHPVTIRKALLMAGSIRRVWELQPWSSAGGEKRAFAPYKLRPSTNFSRKHEVRKSIPINWFNFATSIYLPVWHSQCTRRFSFFHFTVSELAVRSCPLLCMTKRGSGFICCWSLLRNSYDSRHFAAFDYWCLAWQVMQRHSNCQCCHSEFPLGCSIALYQQIIRAVKFHSRALATRPVTSLGQ